MNTRIIAGCFVAGALLLPMVGHAANDADSDRSSPKAFVKDSAITAKIKAKLAREKLSSLLRIKVDTDNKGMVVLNGTVESQNLADRALTIARAEKGVTSVISNIVVKADK